jgi:transposase-like protein
MSVVKRRIFPESFKREAVDRVATSGLSAGAVAPGAGPARDGAAPVDDAVRDASAGPVAV